jgi:hypothetical protein
MNGKEVAYAHFLMTVTGNVDGRSHILDLSNAVQPHNDGMFLESLLCSTVCLASHSNGIQGIALQPFLQNLVYQLQVENLQSSKVSITGLDQLDGMEFTIPYLSPPNQPWPSFVQIPGSRLGSSSRMQNADKIDMWFSCGTTGITVAAEAKDYGTAINLDTMRKILTRVPKEAKLELVFTRKLQGSYFNRPAKSFQEEFQDYDHLLNKSYFKMNVSSRDVVLEKIEGLPGGRNQGCVIFFEISDKLKL